MGEARRKQQEEAKRALEAKALFPGRTIQIDTGATSDAVNPLLTVNVSPVGFKHVKKYGTLIMGAMNTVASVELPKGMKAEEASTLYARALLPTILDNGLELLEECVSFPEHNLALDDLPHQLLPEIVEAWIEESFFDRSKWAPWLEMVERIIEKKTGKKPDLLKKISDVFSKPDSPDEKSSSTDNPG